MGKWLKLNELIYKIPNLLIRGVEDVSSVFVNKYIVLVLAVAVATRMTTTVNDKHPLTSLMGTISNYGTKQSGTDNE